MTDYPLVVAFYFDRAPKYPIYEQAANRLRKRCTELEMAYDICKVDLCEYMAKFKLHNPRTTTERRIVYRYIPLFITQKLTQHKRPILYIHCDSRILRKPDSALFEMPMSVGYSRYHPDTSVNNLFASPLFFRPDAVAHTFLTHWGYMCQNFNTDESEHIFLGHSVRNFKGYPEVKPFKQQISSENKMHDPDILFGQALTKTGEIV